MTESSLFRANLDSFQTKTESKGFTLFLADAIMSLKAGRLAESARSASSTYSATTSYPRPSAYFLRALS